MIDSYGGNLVNYGGNFIGGQLKKDYLEPNVVIRGYLNTFLDDTTIRFYTNETPTATGTTTSYSTAWGTWSNPPVNECYVFSANSAKVDINKVWKGTDTPLSIYDVSSWVEQTGSYASQTETFTGISPSAKGLTGTFSLCLDRTHSASEVKSSGYQLDCSHLKYYAVLKADLAPSSNAVFNNIYTNHPEIGCYSIENMTALSCKSMMGCWVNNEARIGFPAIIKDTVFSLQTSGDFSTDSFFCYSAINVSGADPRREFNVLNASVFKNVHNVFAGGAYVSGTALKSQLYCTNDGDVFLGGEGIFDSDITLNIRAYTGNRNWYIPYYISGSTVNYIGNSYPNVSRGGSMKDTTFSGVLINRIDFIGGKLSNCTPFSGWTFENVDFYTTKGEATGRHFHFSYCKFDNSGVLPTTGWTSASL